MWDLAPPGTLVALEFDFVPEQQYSKLIALANRWEKFEYQPSLELIEKAWESIRPKSGQEPTAANISALREALRKGEFVHKNAVAIEEIRKATGAKLYQRLVTEGTIDPKSPACFVFVPLPCPSPEVYDKALSFIEAACDVAQEKHLSVVIVRSMHGNEEDLKQALKKGVKWNETYLRLPKRYDKFIESGTLRIVDSFPGPDIPTPWGFLFRGAEFVVDGNVAEWAEKPLAILKEFKP